MQSRMTTPVTEESATHAEAWTTVEQALMSEIGKVKDEHTQSMSKLFDLLEKFTEKQRAQERQLAGLRGFARQVEQFLDQHVSRGATAPSNPCHTPRLESERVRVPQGHVPGTSSSSARPPPYLPDT